MMEKEQIQELTVISGSVLNRYKIEIDGKDWEFYVREDKEPKVLWEPNYIDF